MKYLSFDIEAANGYKLYSICSVGIVIADEHFDVVHRENIWINPKTQYNLNGTRKNVGIDLHLDKNLLLSSPDFSQVYDRLNCLLTNKEYVVVGHAVDSDVRMLNATCQHYKLPSINFSFVCSQLLYRLYKGEKEVKALSKIATELGLEYNEHNSEDDAWMSMMTLKYLVQTTGLSLDALLEKYHVRLGSNVNFELTRPVTLEGQVSKRSVTQKAVEQIKVFCKTVKVNTKEYDGKIFAIDRSVELAGGNELQQLLTKIVQNGGKYTARLAKANVYLTCKNPTEQDKMRRIRVEELQKNNLVTVVPISEFLQD